MTTLISTDRVNITQKNFQQILIRGDGKDQFNQIIKKEISLQPPSKNLEIKTSDKYIFAKSEKCCSELLAIETTLTHQKASVPTLLFSLFAFR